MSFLWWWQPNPREPAPQTSASVVWFPCVPLVALGPRGSLSVRPSAVFTVLPFCCSPGELLALTGVLWSPPDGSGADAAEAHTRGPDVVCKSWLQPSSLFSCSWKHFVLRPLSACRLKTRKKCSSQYRLWCLRQRDVVESRIWSLLCWKPS